MTVAGFLRWGARRVLGTKLGGSGLSRLEALPASWTLPLRRDGLDPVPKLVRRGHERPVTRLASLLGMRVWLVTGYEQVRTVLPDTTRYSTDIRRLVGRADASGPDAIGGLGFTDPPEHTRLRRYLAPEFTRRRLARLQPRIDEIVHGRLDALQAAGERADLVSEFAFPVPFLVICELLGLPVSEREEFRRLGDARFDLAGGAAGMLGATAKTRAYLIEAAARQRRRPGEGLIGSLIRAHGDEIDDVELGGLADGLFLGGYETTASMLGLGALALLRDRDAHRLLGRDPDRADLVVEELLRYLTVVQVAFPRFARVAHDLDGHRIRAGDVVVCSLAGANRAPTFGPDPHRLDLRRPDPPPHLAFGHGRHRCLGAELARMELRTAFTALAHRFPDMELAADPAHLRFRQLSIVHGLEALPVRPHGAPPTPHRHRRPGPSPAENPGRGE